MMIDKGYPFDLMTQAINAKHDVNANYKNRTISISDAIKVARDFSMDINPSTGDSLTIAYEKTGYVFTVK